MAIVEEEGSMPSLEGQQRHPNERERREDLFR